jgi:hypothetical protein
VLLAFAMVIGRGIRTADVLSERPLTAPDAGGELRLRTPSRRIPLSPVGVALAATAVLLETAGYVGRLTGATGPVSRVLSMDAPYSAPRTFVSALFAVAAVAAVAGGVRAPGRRTWWLAVGLVCAGIAVVKAGGTVHVDAAAALSAAIGQTGAVVVSVVLAAAVLAVLRLRQPRRAAVTDAGCSAAWPPMRGPRSASPPFRRPSEASGRRPPPTWRSPGGPGGRRRPRRCRPRLVLPAWWLLRREEDAATLKPTERLPGTVRS